MPKKTKKKKAENLWVLFCIGGERKQGAGVILATNKNVLN